MRKLFSLFLILVFGFVLTSCSRQVKPVLDDDDFGLARVSSLSELERLVKQDEKNGLYGFFTDFFGARSSMDLAPENSMDDGSVGGGGEGSSHSKTNNQVDGVDEGDIIKTDGNRIYSITYNRLNVVDIHSNGEMSIALQNTLDAVHGGWYSDLYITDQYLIVIGYHYDYYFITKDGEGVRDDVDTVYPSRGYYGRSMTLVEVYELDALTLVETFEISGYLMTSRLIEDSLYLISTQSVTIYDDLDPRPVFKQGDDVIMPEYTDIKYLPDMSYHSYTIITHIDLGETLTMDYQIFLGNYGWSHVYVSLEGIWMATTLYEYTTFGNYRQYGKLISYQFNEDGSIRYGGAGNFDGTVLNQFAMDEHDGYFRMVTTSGWGDSVVNRLYVFERQTTNGKRVLTPVGLIDQGLGKPRETVRSVRFMGDTATVVTYELIDPFYVIDLSDPKNPTISGELEITGFSTYQHLWSEDLVLGIGYEAEGNMVEGIKLALYDISDPQNPLEVGLPLIMLNGQNGWQYGEALHNHKAILIAKDHDFIGFSIWRYHWFTYDYRQTNDYIIFHIDDTQPQPIQIVATISHIDIYENNLELYPTQYYYDFSVNRAVTIGGVLYVVSGEAITAHTIDADFELVETLIFASN